MLSPAVTFAPADADVSPRDEDHALARAAGAGDVRACDTL